jgi:hypothetical protein
MENAIKTKFNDEGALVFDVTGLVDLVSDSVRAVVVRTLIEELRQIPGEECRQLIARPAGLRVVRDNKTGDYSAHLPK